MTASDLASWARSSFSWSSCCTSLAYKIAWSAGESGRFKYVEQDMEKRSMHYVWGMILLGSEQGQINKEKRIIEKNS